MDMDNQARCQHTEMEPTWQAGTLVGGVPCRTAGASILAGLVLALVHFILTVDTLISWNTLSG